MKLEVGAKTKSGYVLIKKIETLDELHGELMSNPSIYARHKMYASGFIISMHFQTVVLWLKRGWFFTAYKQ